jgi:dihydrofolate reductase
MRIVTYGGACSLDGFLTAAGGQLDWLHWSADAAEIMTAYMASIDTVLMGRRTWEIAQAQGGDAPAGAPQPATYVFSRTLAAIDRPGVTLVKDDAGAFVRRLKQQPGRGICVLGGGDLARSLLEADVIDEIGFNVHPVLLGAGVPAFRDARRRIDLELAACRPIAGGCVYVTYRVKRAG